MTDYFTGKYVISQTWAEHVINTGKPGSVMGGVDYKMGIGTALPAASDGVLEWVTPSTPLTQRPAWYNTGLGNAAAIRRPDGTRTIYGHASRVVSPGQPIKNGEVRVWSGDSGKVTGPHLHTHDVQANGTTRVYPFSTITGGGGSGGGIVAPNGAMQMFTLVNVPDKGLVYVQGIDGRREGVQSAAHLEALQRYYNEMVAGKGITMYNGDLVGQRGAIDWYLNRVNGPRPETVEPAPEPYKFTDEELAKIGAAVKVDVSGLASSIAALDTQADDYQARIEELLNQNLVGTVTLARQ